MAARRAHPVPEDVRTHLMDSALRVFARKGYDGASVRDIAEEARVASGLLYHYFPNKAALLEALFARSGALVMEAFTRVVGIRDPRVRLGALLVVSAEIVRTHEDFWRVSYGVRFQHAVVEGLAAGIAAQNLAFLGLFDALFSELGRPDPAVEARVLFATLDGVFQHFVLDPDSYPLDAVVARVVHDHGGLLPSESP